MIEKHRMLSDTPQGIAPSVTYRTLGTIRIPDLEEAEEVWLQLTHPKYDHTSIECSLDFRSRKAALAILRDPEVLDITISIPKSRRIRIWLGPSWKASGYVLAAKPWAYESLPMEEAIPPDTDIDVDVMLTRGGVLTPGSWRLNDDGSVERIDDAGYNIVWKSSGRASSYSCAMRLKA